MDAAHLDGAPDPDGAASPAEYMARLRAFRRWTGALSLRDLSRRSGVPHTTLGDMLNPQRSHLPRLGIVLAVVRACGADDEHVHAWERSWRRLRVAHEKSRPTTQAPVVHAAIVPAQLPIGLADFTARADETDALGEFCGSARTPLHPPHLATVIGPPGIGKTALVTHVAHEARDNYPDGQLWADLRGASRRPVSPAEALRSFVRALGTDLASVPSGEGGLAAAYRGLLSGRRILVVLDDASSAAQVRPLLPAGPGCTVIVTSRNPLMDLHAANRIHLGPLRPDEAVQLFAVAAGGMLGDDAAVHDIIEACGGIPLALRIAAARLVAEPGLTPQMLAERLADPRRRLAELRVDDRAARLTFEIR